MLLRVASYNVHSFRGGLDAVASVLIEASGGQPLDVVFLQECGSTRAVRRFSGHLGMEAVSSHRLFNRVRNAVVYRPPLKLTGEPSVRDLTHQSRSLRRGFIAATLRADVIRFAAVSVHLGLVPSERLRHGRELTDFLAGLRCPVVMGADLNEGPDGPAARWLGARLFDAFDGERKGSADTFPAAAPTARIDYMFLTSEFSVRRAWVGASASAKAASDHRPVLAEIEMREPEGPRR